MFACMHAYMWGKALQNMLLGFRLTYCAPGARAGRDGVAVPGTCQCWKLGEGRAAANLTPVKREINIFNLLWVIEGTIGVFF